MVLVGLSRRSLLSASIFALFASQAAVSVAATPDSDFAARCSAPGVVKCVGFDKASDIAGRYAANSGILSGASTPTLDAAVRASGGSSIKFTIPPFSGPDTSGSYFANFSSDLQTQFGENSEFFIQWRQRFSPEFVSTTYAGHSGIKQVIITTGDQPGKIYNSCESTGVVMTTYASQRFPVLYQSCTGSRSHAAYDAFYQPFPGGTDFRLQNARPAPGCLYSQRSSSYFPPSGNCFGWFPNEWMTFQIRIKTGPRVGDEFTQSYVDLWMAREGRPSEHVIRWGPYALSAAVGEKYGKIWLTPYQTSKDRTQNHPTGYTWYDELIISRTKIADPGVGAPPPTSGGGSVGNVAPSVNITSPAANTSLLVPAAVNLAATATDPDGSISKVEFYRNATLIATVATPSGGGVYTYTDANRPAGSYNYTAKVYDNTGAAATSTSRLVTVNALPATPVNVASQAHGGIAEASSAYNGPSGYFPASKVNDGNRRGGGGQVWVDATPNALPDGVQLTFNGTYTINQLHVFSVQDSFSAPAEPTSTMTFTKYGVTAMHAQYWNGSAWVEIPGTRITGNNRVWRQLVFAPVTTNAVRVWIDGVADSMTRLAEVEAWTTGAGGENIAPTVALTSPVHNTMLTAPGTVDVTATAAASDVSKVEFYRGTTLIGTAAGNTGGVYTLRDTNVQPGTYTYTAQMYNKATPPMVIVSAPSVVTVTAAPSGSLNVAAQANGGVTTASTFYSGSHGYFPPSKANDGNRRGGLGQAWIDSTPDAFPDVLQVKFNKTYPIAHVDIFSSQDNGANPVEPTTAMTFTEQGLRTFQVQYWNGSAWLDVPGGKVADNDRVWRRVAFPPVSTDSIRVVVTDALASMSRVIELEAWTAVAVAAPTPPTSPPVESDPSPTPGDSGTPPDPASMNPALATLPSNTVMYLGKYQCSDVSGEYAGKCKLITDFSGMVYDKKRGQMVVFGGGHASTNYDAVNTFSMETLTWTEKYKPTNCSSIVAGGNFDASKGAWRSGPSGPYPRPAARHTVDLMAIPDDKDELILLTFVEGNGLCPGLAYTSYDFQAVGKIAHYNFGTNQWTFSNSVPDTVWGAAEYDPVSKKIVMLSTEGLFLYDPATRVKTKAVDLTVNRIRDENGAVLANLLYYNNQLVYYPPNGKMYYFERTNKRVYEVTLDRANFSKSTIVRLATTGTPSTHSTPGYAYDSANQIIGGAVDGNKFSAFNPMTKTWTTVTMQGGAPGRQAFHALNYDPVNNVFIFITDARETYAYRYRRK